MIDLVTLEQAKNHLRVVDSGHNFDIEMKIRQASSIVMEYEKLSAIPDSWVKNYNLSPVTYDIPGYIQAMTLLVLGELYENREASAADILSNAVRSLGKRPPTMA